MLKLLARLLVPLATVFFSIGLLMCRRCVAYTSKAVSKDQDNVALIKSTKAQPGSGVGILSENDGPVVLETACAVSSAPETVERYLAQKGMLDRYSVTGLASLCVRSNRSPGRAMKEAMVRALLSELEFDSVQLNQKGAVTTF